MYLNWYFQKNNSYTNNEIWKWEQNSYNIISYQDISIKNFPFYFTLEKFEYNLASWDKWVSSWLITK